MPLKGEESAGCCSSSITVFTATAANDDEDINNEMPQQQSPLTSTTTTSSASESCIPSSMSKASLWNLPSMDLSLTQRNKIRTSSNNHNQRKTRKRHVMNNNRSSAISCGLLLLCMLLVLLGTTSLVSAQRLPPPQERLLRSKIEAQVKQQLQSQLTPRIFQTTELQEQRQLQPSQIPRTFSISESRQVKKYALPAFSMVLRLRLSEEDYQYNDGDDGNFLQIYLDLEILQETIERVTQLHLTDMFQQFAGSYVDFHSERFIGVALTTKVRQLDLAGGTDDDDGGAAIEFDNDDDTSDASVPLHAAFSGLVTFSFPSDAVPPSERVDEAIEHVLKTSLTAENYLLLFRRFLSTGALENLQDLEDIRIGDTLVSVITTSNGNAAGGSNNGKEDAPTNVNVHSGSSSKKKGMNAVTIAAIAIFLTFSCLLMLFGATVILLMQDRAKQEERFQERAIANMNNSDHSNGSGETDKSAGDDGEDNDQNKTDNNSSDDDSSTEATPAWKRAVLPVLRKAIMVRRYWRRYLRKQRRYQKHSDPKNQGPEQSLPPNDEENVNNFSPAFEEEDDGLNDEDVYFDEGLSDEEAANQWLDSWSASLTSIPLRQPNGNNNRRSARSKSSSPGKRKKKSKSSSPLAPHPAKRQSRKTFLGCIAEEDSVIEASNSQEVPSPHNNGSDTISASTDSSLLMVAPSDELERDAATAKVQAQSMLCGSIPEDEEEFGSPPRDFETDAKVRAYDGASVRRKPTNKSDQEFLSANGRSSSSFDDEKKELEKMEELLERSGSNSRLNTSTGSFDVEDTPDMDPTYMEDVEDVDLS